MSQQKKNESDGANILKLSLLGAGAMLLFQLLQSPGTIQQAAQVVGNCCGR